MLGCETVIKSIDEFLKRFCRHKEEISSAGYCNVLIYFLN